MNGYDGPTLRAIRENQYVSIRRIAREAGMSAGHLSKVERGEYGRPVTPAIIAAYQRALKVDLSHAVEMDQHSEGLRRRSSRQGGTWWPGQLSDLRRRGYTAAIGSLSIGGLLGEPFGRVIDSTGRPLAPAPPDELDVSQLAQLAEWITSVDLRHGGGLVSQLSKTILRWAVPMLDTINESDPVSRRLHAALGSLAHRAAWAAFDIGAHDPARSLFRLALYAATRAKDRDLRAHVLADVAAQYTALGYHEDCLEILRIASGDEQISPAVSAVLHAVRARACAAAGQVSECHSSLERLEAVHADANPDQPGWLGALAHPAHLYASIGHSLAVLAGHAGTEQDRKSAAGVLTQAVDTFDPKTHARAHALCVSRLALLNITAGALEEGARWARLALRSTAIVRSLRLNRDLASIKDRAAEYPGESTMRQLLEEFEDAAETGEEATHSPNDGSPDLQGGSLAR